MKVVLFANTDWYLYNFRRSLALALRDAGHEVVLVSPPGAFGPRLQALGLRWLQVPMQRRSLNPIRELTLVWRLARMFKREAPAIVHGFTIKPAVYGSLAARLAGVRGRVNAVAGMGYVFTSGDRLARGLRPLVRALLRIALGGDGARVVLQNPDDLGTFQRTGLADAGRLVLIPGSGVDCARFRPRAGPREPGPTRVLLAARLLWDKGIAEYIEAARRLAVAAEPMHFLLAGEPDPGNPAAVPEHVLRRWVDEGVVEWLGHVDDMAALYARVDVVVLPSYREGLPKGLIEAAASGLPLVTTDVPGCREVVSDGVDGLLIPPRDPIALAEAIGRLAADPALAHRLGAAARAKALAQFDERLIVARTVAVYEELLGREQGACPTARGRDPS